MKFMHWCTPTIPSSFFSVEIVSSFSGSTRVSFQFFLGGGGRDFPPIWIIFGQNFWPERIRSKYVWEKRDLMEKIHNWELTKRKINGYSQKHPYSPRDVLVFTYIIALITPAQSIVVVIIISAYTLNLECCVWGWGWRRDAGSGSGVSGWNGCGGTHWRLKQQQQRKSNVLGATTNQFTIILISVHMDFNWVGHFCSRLFIYHFIDITMIIFALSRSVARSYLYE